MSSPASAILTVRQLAWPAPWASLFGREAPLWMEIGFGGADYLVALAAAHPEVNVVGVEISQPSLRKAVRKADRQALGNVRVIHASVQEVLWALCSPASLGAVFINFPDPWPKPAHHHRRLIDAGLLQLLASRLATGAHLAIATDHADYADVIGTLLMASPYFASVHRERWVKEAPDRVATKYEQLARAEGRDCFYFRWRRNEVGARRSYPVPEEYAMPHVVLRNTLDPEGLWTAPLTGTKQIAGVTVRFVGVFASPSREIVIVDTHIEEMPVSQRVALSIRSRGADELILGLHALGFPRKTSGVHFALHFLTERLQKLCPTTEIVQSNLKYEEV